MQLECHRDTDCLKMLPPYNWIQMWTLYVCTVHKEIEANDIYDVFNAYGSCGNQAHQEQGIQHVRFLKKSLGYRLNYTLFSYMNQQIFSHSGINSGKYSNNFAVQF